MSHSCSLTTLAVISVISQQSCGDEDNTRKQTSSNTEGFLQNTAVALAATYAVASSLSVVPSAPTEKEEASPGTLESIPEINDHPHASSTTEEESKLDAMEYTGSVEFEYEEEDAVKRAPLYAVEERNYQKRLDVEGAKGENHFLSIAWQFGLCEFIRGARHDGVQQSQCAGVVFDR